VKEDEVAELLNEIGQLLAEDTDYPLNGTLLYAQLDWGYVAPSIFKDRGDHVLYREPDLDRLGDVLLDLWNAQDSKNPWTEFEYVVHDGKFRATFGYPDEGHSKEDLLAFDRRELAVAKHFGDKPIVYPPMPNDPAIVEYEP
jgi:hypothetical protein